MKILLTGGAGYIGSHTILEILENTDWEILSVDNYLNSSTATYDRIKDISGIDVAHEELDLCDLRSLRELLKHEKFNGVMHFAALKAVGESVDNPGLYYKNNLEGLINILTLQREFKIPYHIYSSSCTVYGDAAELPVSERSPSGRAESPYGWTKVMGEQILKDMAHDGTDFKALALRYFNPVGAHSSGKIGELPKGIPNNLVPYITQTASGHRPALTIHGNDYNTPDGTCIRDYVHVSDIASAHVLAMKYLIEAKDVAPFDFTNLGTGNGVSVKETVEAFMKVNQVPLNYVYGPRRSGDVVSMFADNAKAYRQLGWVPKRNLEEMMRSAWAWQKELDAQSL